MHYSFLVFHWFFQTFYIRFQQAPKNFSSMVESYKMSMHKSHRGQCIFLKQLYLLRAGVYEALCEPFLDGLWFNNVLSIAGFLPQP